MYYKLKKGSTTYDLMIQMWNRILDCNNQAKLLVESLGYTKYAIDNQCNYVAGGISCIYSENPIPGYRMVGKKHQNLYFPKASNKELIKKISDLPRVSDKEFNDVINFDSKFIGLSHIRRYGLFFLNNVFYIDIPDNADYIPIEGLEEILTSEYKNNYEQFSKKP